MPIFVIALSENAKIKACNESSSYFFIVLESLGMTGMIVFVMG